MKETHAVAGLALELNRFAAGVRVARLHEDQETIKNGSEMLECARDTPMNQGVNERKALHEYALVCAWRLAFGMDKRAGRTQNARESDVEPELVLAFEKSVARA